MSIYNVESETVTEQLNGHRSADFSSQEFADFRLNEDSVKIDYTDVGNALRLVKKHRHEIRYVKQWGWLKYDGKRWARVEHEDIRKLAKQVLWDMKKEALELSKNQDTEEKGKKLGYWAYQSENGYHLNNMVEFAKDHVLAKPEDFDQDGWLFNALDCTIDLRTGLTHPHRPEDMLTKIAGTAYDEGVQGSRWFQFIEEIFGGDTATIEYVQMVLGMSLTDDTSEKHIWFPYGTGDNGKTILFEITGQAMGEYATVGQTEVIVTHGKGFRNKTFGTANLVGYRRAVFAETQEGDKLNWDIIKPMTGQDTMPVEAKYRKAQNVLMHLKVFVYTNALPRVEEVGTAEWGRIRVVPFNQCFSNDVPGCHKPDKYLKSKLRSELPAVLRWLVGGCLLWQEYGLVEPESVKDATNQYHEDQDALSGFLKDEVIRDPSAKTKLSDVYERYQAWFDGPDWQAPINRDSEMGNALKAQGFIKTTIRGRSWYKGLRLKTAEERDPDAQRYTNFRGNPIEPNDDEDFDPDE